MRRFIKRVAFFLSVVFRRWDAAETTLLDVSTAWKLSDLSIFAASEAAKEE